MTCHLTVHGELRILTLNYMTKPIVTKHTAVVAQTNVDIASQKALDGRNYLSISMSIK